MLQYEKIEAITPELFMKEFDPTIKIGVTPSGDYLSLKLSKVVHLLFGGQSGSGKSVFVLQLFYQLLFLTNPKSLQFLLVDPLRVSFKDFKQLPHLLAPIWNTAPEAVKIIELMMEINNERYRFLEGVGFENIYDYNKALAQNKIPYKGEDGTKETVSLSKISREYIKKTKTDNYKLWEPMSQIVVMFDEFNKLMLDEDFGGKKPEEATSPALKNLVGISEQARKAGIIIVLGTQKIDARTVPTKIRGNMKTRICLKVDGTMASRTILGDTPENNTSGVKLAGYGDGLIFNLDLNGTQALRFQSAYVSEHDLLELVNGMVKAYGTNDFEYIQVNEEYAKSLDDLEMSPIDPSIFTPGLPDIVIVSDSIFMKQDYQKLLSEIIRNPAVWDDKQVALNYPSIVSKTLKVVRHQLFTAKILAVNIPEPDEDEEEEDTKKKGKKDKEEGDFWLNLKLPGLQSIMNTLGWDIETPRSWDTEDETYQNYLMKLLLLRLNKVFVPKAKDISIDINQYM